MNKSRVLLAAVALLITACASPYDRPRSDDVKSFNVAAAQRPSPCNVVVYVLLGAVQVDQEPTITIPGICGNSKTIKIDFYLDPNAASTFPLKDAIKFSVNPPDNIHCDTSKDQQKVNCAFDRPKKVPTSYKYLITVDGATPLDPTVFAN